MKDKQIITINGVRYDTHTGARLDTPPRPQHTPPLRSAIASTTVHNKTARSQTLSRQHIQAPPKKPAVSKSATIQRSPMVRKFADIAAPAQTHLSPNTATTPDIRPTTHPIQPQAKQSNTPAVQKSPEVVKRQAIAVALSCTAPQQPAKYTSFFARHPRVFSVSGALVAIVALAGYFTYVNLPNISVQFAGMQAGIHAAYPSYQPSGYGLHEPVEYDKGQVKMKFSANVGSQNYTLTQVKSGWDSSALLQNYVMSVSNGSYNTYNDGGLTIYTYGSNAAWVSGGILHTIQGDAPLSSDQVRKIATSMQ